MSALDELKVLLIPPTSPTGGAVDWAAVAAEVGFEPPADYREFATRYGPGAVDGFLWVLHPAFKGPYLNLQTQIKVRLDALRALRAQGEQLPYPPFPEPGGVIPWGFTDNGDVCYWRSAEADPSLWPVLVNEGRGSLWHEFPGSMAEFLLAVLTGRHRVPIFPADFPSLAPFFLSVS